MNKTIETSVTINKALDVVGTTVLYSESFVIPKYFLETLLETELAGSFESVKDFLENYEPEEDGQAVYDLAEEAGVIENEFTRSKESDNITGDIDPFDEDNELTFENLDDDIDEEDYISFDEDEEDIESFIKGEPLNADDSDAFEELPEL